MLRKFFKTCRFPSFKGYLFLKIKKATRKEKTIRLTQKAIIQMLGLIYKDSLIGSRKQSHSYLFT